MPRKLFFFIFPLTNYKFKICTVPEYHVNIKKTIYDDIRKSRTESDASENIES